ncbi:hypothetical protein PG997_006563 [Apiospora hydei]|uniref:Helicase C-terminal domain-containing protein n=1 Tax=Apiospora hydei TaxID=1337664 RepID=A0ABR1WP30_9PEZI
MDRPWLAKYIPAGCLRLPSHEKNSLPADDETGPRPTADGWQFLSRDDRDDVPKDLSVPNAHRSQLLALQTLAPFAAMFRAKWIQLELKGHIVRVYVLPHDVDRISIERKGAKLFKDLGILLKQLDYSPATWNGSEEGHGATGSNDNKEEDDDLSLLERFNRFPSPDPQIHDVTNAFDKGLIRDVLDSKIFGITTTLIPIQRKSVAEMLRRELAPRQVLDPRLLERTDQNGNLWYSDFVKGEVLREPRYYDAVRGGLLCEEMGLGKTIMCLSVICATKGMPTTAPEPYTASNPKREKKASLMDMAAAAVNRYSVPWRQRQDLFQDIPPPCVWKPSRRTRTVPSTNWNLLLTPWFSQGEGRRNGASHSQYGREVQITSSTLVIVPNNLVRQWQKEIKKHTVGLSTLVLEDLKSEIPVASILKTYDIILLSKSRVERIERDRDTDQGYEISILQGLRFKRCIIDEGHGLGNGSRQWRTDFMVLLDALEIDIRWVVTGTPTKGLYGVSIPLELNPVGRKRSAAGKGAHQGDDETPAAVQERDDLLRIGNITAKFLKIRPWSNTKHEAGGDSQADWSVYVLQPKHSKKSCGSIHCLETTLKSLIVRHRLSDVEAALPPVQTRNVILEGSYQDKLALNLFSMMIISNSVQSQRTDMDYFFHPKQRSALLQLVSNLKQASFFGGVFYSDEEIDHALERAEEFLVNKKVPISDADKSLLADAIAFGKLASDNGLKDISNTYHALPLYLEYFPGGNDHAQAWSLADEDPQDGELICTDASLIQALQRFLNPMIDAPTSLQLMMDTGAMARQGLSEKQRMLNMAGSVEGDPASSTLAGSTAVGVDHHTISQPLKMPSKADQVLDQVDDNVHPHGNVEIAAALTKTQIVSTVSAKLTYLIDSIVKYQNEEKIIVFFENDNVAYYLAQVLEILQVQHLIYTRQGLNAQRRGQYIQTFLENDKFRVCLMDLSQAAFGLDMRTASRIYFLTPVLNPQVEQQAIGRARRLTQPKPISVETLVLKGSIEELIVERREAIPQAEHRKIKSILDDKPIYDWILNARIMPMPERLPDAAQTSKLETPQLIFGRGFGREIHPDEGLVLPSPEGKGKGKGKSASNMRDRGESPEATTRYPRRSLPRGAKRSYTSMFGSGATGAGTDEAEAEAAMDESATKRTKKTARVAFAD